MSEIAVNTTERLDELEAAMLQNFPETNCPVIHRFVPNMYIREIFMPAETMIVSRIHNTSHPFIISAGVAHVKINDGDWQRLEAPYSGITQPGTRRVLFIENDCVWTTVHYTPVIPESGSEEDILKAVSKVEDQIIEKHINQILGGELKNNIVSQLIENE